MRALGWVCALCLMAGSAVAFPVTWEASGTIMFVRDSAAMSLDPQVGDKFTYAITFDNDTPDTDVSSGAGNFPAAIQSAIFSAGGQSYALPIDTSLAYSFNDGGSDYYQFSLQITSGAVDNLPLFVSRLDLWSTSPLALDTDAIPSFPPPDLSFYQAWFSMVLYQTPEQLQGVSPIPFVQGKVDSVIQRPVGVPEPDTTLLFATSLVGAGLARRRKAS